MIKLNIILLLEFQIFLTFRKIINRSKVIGIQSFHFDYLKFDCIKKLQI